MKSFITWVLTALGVLEIVLWHVAMILVAMFCIMFFGPSTYDMIVQMIDRLRGRKKSIHKPSAAYAAKL